MLYRELSVDAWNTCRKSLKCLQIPIGLQFVLDVCFLQRWGTYLEWMDEGCPSVSDRNGAYSELPALQLRPSNCQLLYFLWASPPKDDLLSFFLILEGDLHQNNANLRIWGPEGGEFHSIFSSNTLHGIFSSPSFPNCYLPLIVL